MEFVVANWNMARSLAKSCLRIGSLASFSGTETGSGTCKHPNFSLSRWQRQRRGSGLVVPFGGYVAGFQTLFLSHIRHALLDRMPATMVSRFSPVFYLVDFVIDRRRSLSTKSTSTLDTVRYPCLHTDQQYNVLKQ